MNHYPLDLETINSWLRSKEQIVKENGVTLAEIVERTTHIPTARADYDSEYRMGRISIWVSGEFDFEVLRVSDGKPAHFHHETVPNIQAPSLDAAFAEFIQHMANQD